MLPGFYARKSKLNQINVNPESEFIKVLTSEEQPDKSYNIIARYFSKTGNLIKSTQISAANDIDLTTGIAPQNGANTNIIAGTYSNSRPRDESTGIFIANLSNTGSENLTFIKLTDLDNFFGYMKGNREERMKKRIARKERKNKVLNFERPILLRDVTKEDDHYIILFEISNALKSRYGITMGNIDNFDGAEYKRFIANGFNSIYADDPMLPFFLPNGKDLGFTYSHAVILKTDKKGQVLWDNIIDTKDISFNDQLINKVKMVKTNKGNVLMYLNHQKLGIKSLVDGKTNKEKYKEPLKLKSETDKLNKSVYNFEGFNKWYNNTFYTYGVNSISNTKISVPNERKVFFINKVVIK